MSVAQWSTADVHASERFAYWREAVCDAFLDLRPERTRAPAFHGKIVVERRHQLEIAHVSAAAQHVHRRPSHDGGWCYLNLQAKGTGMTSQGGRTVVTAPGDAVVIRTDQPFDFRFDEDFAQLSVRLPSDLSALVHSPILLRGDSPEGVALRTLLHLSPLLDSGTDRSGDRASDLDRWLDTAIVDLVRTSIRGVRPPLGAKTAIDLWPLIDADIDRHLRDPTLDPAATAARVGLSVRALHQRFRERPLTFSREVRRRRLALARRLLTDPAHDGLRIRDIAADCGFVDVHHFQRIYRHAFDQSPGATRAERSSSPSDRPVDGRQQLPPS